MLNRKIFKRSEHRAIHKHLLHGEKKDLCVNFHGTYSTGSKIYTMFKFPWQSHSTGTWNMKISNTAFFLTTILATKWDNSEQPVLTQAYRSGWKVFWDNSAPVCYQGTSPRVKTVEQTSSSPQPVSHDVLLKHSLASVVTRKVSSICFISVLTEPQQIQGWKQLRSGNEAKQKEEWYVT